MTTTFEECEEIMSNNRDLIDKANSNPKFPYVVERFIILPKSNKQPDLPIIHNIVVYGMTLKKALEDKNALNEDLDVYVYASVDGQHHWMPLLEYKYYDK